MADHDVASGDRWTGLDDAGRLRGGRVTVPTTVAIPTHPARGNPSDPSTLLGRAIASVYAQTMLPAGGITIASDVNGDGAAATRQSALDLVSTEFVSFLDSDDTFYPHHLETHWGLITNSGAGYPDAPSADGFADVAYSWFDGNDPFPMHRGRVFDPKEPHHLTMTLTIRTALAKQVGLVNHADANGEWSGEDWRMILGLRDLGAIFVGTGEVTWTYHVTGVNTSGLPTLGDGPLTTGGAAVRPC
jgi:hypothetical protein